MKDRKWKMKLMLSRGDELRVDVSGEVDEVTKRVLVHALEPAVRTSLSSRCRADVECAPWVLDEIKQLETELGVAESLYKVVLAERNHAWYLLEMNKWDEIAEKDK